MARRGPQQAKVRIQMHYLISSFARFGAGKSTYSKSSCSMPSVAPSAEATDVGGANVISPNSTKKAEARNYRRVGL